MHFSPIFPIGAMLQRLLVSGSCNDIKSGNTYWKMSEFKPCIWSFHTAKWLRVLMEMIFWGPPSSMALTRLVGELHLTNDCQSWLALNWRSLWWATLASMLRWFWPNLEFCYKNRTPGSDPIKCGLYNGNVVEVDLEKKPKSTAQLEGNIVGPNDSSETVLVPSW